MSLIDIGHAIDKNDADAFLMSYIACLAQGYALSVPEDGTLDEMMDRWDIILSKYRRNFSDEFCQAVANQWHALLEKCDRDKDLVPQICVLMDVSYEKIPVSGKNKDRFKTNKGPMNAPNQAQNQSNDDHIILSQPLDALIAMREKAFRSSHASMFVLAHLALAKHGDAQSVPKASVPEHIRGAWESIIIHLFDTLPDDDFLKKITDDWCYLVTQYGIPVLPDDHIRMFTIYINQRATLGIVNAEAPTDRSFLSFIKRLFF